MSMTPPPPAPHRGRGRNKPLTQSLMSVPTSTNNSNPTTMVSRQRKYASAGAAVTSLFDEDCSGWLWKKSGFFGTWKNRFFSLRGSILSYYDKFPSEHYNLTSTTTNTNDTNAAYFVKGERSTPRGVIRVVHVEHSSSIGFKVFGMSGKVLDIRCDTPKRTNSWIKALSVASTLGKRKQWDKQILLHTEKEEQQDSVSTMESITEEEAIHHLRSTNFCTKSGWLSKRNNGRWKSKFYVLQDCMLSELENELSWTVPNARGYVLEVLKSSKNTTGLVISLSGVRGKVVVNAESKEERSRWYRMLRDAVKELEERAK